MLRTAVATAALLAATFVPAAAEAAMYKCVDANGGVTFTQTRCPTNDGRVESLKSVRGSSGDRDCGLVGAFASRTARSMKRGRSSSAVFDTYGGAGALTPTAMGIVSYVYEFRGNTRASAERIAALAVNRCRGGAYANVGCDAFPPAFTADTDTCGDPFAAARFPRGAAVPHADPRADPRAVPADYPASADARRDPAAERTARCRHRVAIRIDGVNATMRASQSAHDQDRLRERRHALSRELRDC